MNFWNKRKRMILLGVAVLIVGVLLAACGNPPPPKPSLDSGEIIQIVKHDDVEVKDKVCTGYKTDRFKQNGKWKTKKVCKSHRIVEREISPEWYEFELKSGNKTGWTGSLDENTGQRYQVGDIYP